MIGFAHIPNVSRPEWASNEGPPEIMSDAAHGKCNGSAHDRSSPHASTARGSVRRVPRTGWAVLACPRCLRLWRGGLEPLTRFRSAEDARDDLAELL